MVGYQLHIYEHEHIYNSKGKDIAQPYGKLRLYVMYTLYDGTVVKNKNDAWKKWKEMKREEMNERKKEQHSANATTQIEII